MLKIVVGLLVAFGAMQAVLAAPGRDALDGAWTISLVKDNPAGKTVDDVLTFKDGKVNSEKMAVEGFAASTYEIDTRGVQTTAFTATSKSEKAGTIAWTGTAIAGQLTGTITVTRADGSTQSYAFTGTKVAM